MTLLGRLELVDFPRPDVARTLSVNGRAHHMARYRTTRDMAYRVKLEAATQGLRPMRGLVSLKLTYVLPLHRLRDTDNFSGGGVTKAVIDALVRGGYLEADDTEHLRLLPVEIRVEKGVRMLVLEFEQAESVRPVLPLAQEAVDLGLRHAEAGFPPTDQDGLELTAADPAAHGLGVDAQAIRDVLDGQHAFGGHDHAQKHSSTAHDTRCGRLMVHHAARWRE